MDAILGYIGSPSRYYSLHDMVPVFLNQCTYIDIGAIDGRSQL
jgi:hypothetical protein